MILNGNGMYVAHAEAIEMLVLGRYQSVVIPFSSTSCFNVCADVPL